MRKRQKLLLWLFVCVLLFLTGCKEGKDAVSGEDPGRAEEEQDSQGEEEQDSQGEEEGRQDSSIREEAQPADGFPRELSRTELQDFTIWINQGGNYGNYGFLLSEYTKPQDVDLSQVFYTGAGMETEQLTPEEEKAFLKEANEDEIYTDCTRLTTDQINEFLDLKLGLSLEDMTKGLPWIYLQDSDAWVHEHGDTNYMSFTCVSGKQTAKDTYELNCVPGREGETPYLPSCRLTLQSYGEDYRILSNIYIERLSYSKDIWIIEDQTFDINLGDGWGDVTFTSYEPDVSVYSTQDVTFSLVKDGETLYKFPAVAENNFLSREIFNQVVAVGFRDYNDDGSDDVIIIVEYKPIVSAGDGETFLQVRLYRNCAGEGRFVLDIDRAEYLNLNGYNHTVQEVMEHVEEAASVE